MRFSLARRLKKPHPPLTHAGCSGVYPLFQWRCITHASFALSFSSFFFLLPAFALAVPSFACLCLQSANIEGGKKQSFSCYGSNRSSQLSLSFFFFFFFFARSTRRFISFLGSTTPGLIPLVSHTPGHCASPTPSANAWPMA